MTLSSSWVTDLNFSKGLSWHCKRLFQPQNLYLSIVKEFENAGKTGIKTNKKACQVTGFQYYSISFFPQIRKKSIALIF